MTKLRNTTLRIEDELRDKAEESAKASNRTLAEELRFALANYYGMAHSQVSLETVKSLIEEHVAAFHSLPSPVTTAVLAPAGRIRTETEAKAGVDDEIHNEPEEEKKPKLIAPASAEDLELHIKVLQTLRQKILEGQESGIPPTPKDLEKACGSSSRALGRILARYGIAAKNTRIGNKASRYFLPSLIPQIEDTIAKLNSMV